MTYNLHEGLGYKLTLAAQVNNQILIKLLAELNLTRQMWCILVAVGEQQIHQPSAIADYIGIQRAAVSRTLKDMHQKQLLVRTNAADNAKQTLVHLTPQGLDLLSRSLPMTEQSAIRLKNKLSKAERAELERLLNKYLSGPLEAPARI
ncbi:MAG: MarR family winged helix-turn-helix transcriptional regulator [Gammaproteobacteria bacterium]|jgi:DNA-binding MarR family transcriptional regulator|nr:MarR family winged helix-turn-helix transcriptional regulator [Gammaproteobacteria bacterium]